MWIQVQPSRGAASRGCGPRHRVDCRLWSPPAGEEPPRGASSNWSSRLGTGDAVDQIVGAGVAEAKACCGAMARARKGSVVATAE